METRFSESRHGRIGKYGRIRNLSSTNQRKRSIDQTKMKWIHLPICRWHSKIVRKRLRIPRTHSQAGTSRKERKSQRRISRRTGRVSTDRIKRWHWSPYRLLVDSRWLHLSSSQWTSSSTPCAERRNILHATEIHWCNQVHSYKSGLATRKTNLLSLTGPQTQVMSPTSASTSAQTSHGSSIRWTTSKKKRLWILRWARTWQVTKQQPQTSS